MIMIKSDSALVNVNKTLKFIPESRAAHHRFPWFMWTDALRYFSAHGELWLKSGRTQLYNNIDFSVAS